MFSSITSGIVLVAGAIGAVLVAAFGMIARQSGKNAEKAAVATAEAAATQRMAQAAQSAPRNAGQIEQAMREGKF